VRKPYDLLVTTLILLFRASTAPAEISPLARNQFKISSRCARNVRATCIIGPDPAPQRAPCPKLKKSTRTPTSSRCSNPHLTNHSTVAGIWGQTRSLDDRTLGPVDLTGGRSDGPSRLWCSDMGTDTMSDIPIRNVQRETFNSQRSMG